MLINLSNKSRKAWSLFLSNNINLGHVNRKQSGINLDEHIKLCMISSEKTALRVKYDLPSNFSPVSILEVGCSTGLNCYALQKVFPKAKVIGLEPEQEALDAALSMKQGAISPNFIKGVSEKIEIEDNSIDLIVCHTVIEHVKNVEQSIKEFSRILKLNGIIHLDAPNYVWPYEPHLKIWTVPLLGKNFVKWTAQIQGKKKLINFLDHLQFVTPFKLEKLFLNSNLKWQNRAKIKLQNTANGVADIKKYKFLSRILFFSKILKISKLIIFIIYKLGFYPSVMYTVYKPTLLNK